MDTPIIRAEHEEFARRIEEENERQNHRIAALEESIKESTALVANVERLAVNMENMLKEQERQGKRLEALESRDGEMWRKVVAYIVTAVVGIIIGFIATRIGVQASAAFASAVPGIRAAAAGLGKAAVITGIWRLAA